jgi:hypothetical protein
MIRNLTNHCFLEELNEKIKSLRDDSKNYNKSQQLVIIPLELFWFGLKSLIIGSFLALIMVLLGIINERSSN